MIERISRMHDEMHTQQSGSVQYEQHASLEHERDSQTGDCCLNDSLAYQHKHLHVT
jgi:hypothetical protein